MTLRPILLCAAMASALLVAGCSFVGGGGGGTSAGALTPALSARMDQPNATLDSVQAINLINAYRATQNMPPLTADAGLNGTAQALASQYAQTNVAPTKPQAGWRNNAADAIALTANATKAGVAVAFNPSSSYGTYWVLVIGN